MKTVKLLIIPVFLLFVILQSDGMQIYIDGVANQVESVNPRFANLLKGEEEGDLSSDKSWLHRKLMVDKGIEVFKKYPILGIGPFNFRFFDSELSTYNEYDRLTNLSLEFYNNRSSHNSYIQILAENGIMGLLTIILILLTPIKYFFKSFLNNRLFVTLLPLISIFGMSMHFYAIAALSGAIPWVVIGLSIGTINFLKK